MVKKELNEGIKSSYAQSESPKNKKGSEFNEFEKLLE